MKKSSTSRKQLRGEKTATTPKQALHAALLNTMPQEYRLLSELIPRELGAVLAAGVGELGEFFTCMGQVCQSALAGDAEGCTSGVLRLRELAESATARMAYEGNVRGVNFSKSLGEMLLRFQAAAAAAGMPQA